MRSKRFRFLLGFVLVLGVLGSLGWSCKDYPPVRRLLLGTLAAAYAVWTPGLEVPSVCYGPSEAPRAEAVVASTLQSELQARFSRETFTVRVEDAKRALPPVVFHHEALSSPKVRQFEAAAREVFGSEDDPFQLCNRTRQLTFHGLSKVQEDDDPLQLLAAARAGEGLICLPFAKLYVETCVTRGYTARVLGLSDDGRAFVHAVTEVYVPAQGKWVLVDPDFNISYRRGQEFLNAAELHQAWMALKNTPALRSVSADTLRQLVRSGKLSMRETTGIEVVVWGEAGQELRDIQFTPGKCCSCTGMNLEFFAYVFYPIRNDYLSAHYPLGHPVRVTQYVLPPKPRDPPPPICPEATVVSSEESLYWPVGGISFHAEQIEGTAEPLLVLALATWTPNFAHFDVTVDGQAWPENSSGQIRWPLHPGTNSLTARAVNACGVAGEAAELEIRVGTAEPRPQPLPTSDKRGE